MSKSNSSSHSPCILAVLRMAGLRPTRQRVALAKLLFNKDHRHVCAETLYEEAKNNGAQISLATIYNSLHQFAKVGLLREISVDAGKSYFDTNTSDHHHFYLEDEQRVIDIPMDSLVLKEIPIPPKGMEVTAIDVVMRLKRI